MPMTPHGQRMRARLGAEYGREKGDQVLYASRNAGKPAFQNIDDKSPIHRRMKKAMR